MERYRDAALPAAQAGAWAAKYRPPSSRRPDVWHGDLGAETVRAARQGYYGSVSFLDEQIGRILEVLDRQRALERTFILFLADHGDMLGDHYLWRKSYPYEPSARIPMMLHWPEGLPRESRGRVIARPTEIRDILPAVLEAAGAGVPAKVEGASLLALARDPARDWRPWIDLEHDVCYSPENHWNALTDGDWKYIFHAYNGQEQLFHLVADPYELNDLAGSQPAELRKWRSRMIAHLSSRGEPWVVRGELGIRRGSQLHSPNYPR